jgi:hypothetical protein
MSLMAVRRYIRKKLLNVFSYAFFLKTIAHVLFYILFIFLFFFELIKTIVFSCYAFMHNCYQYVFCYFIFFGYFVSVLLY